MQPRPTKLTIRVKGGVHEVVNSTARSHQDNVKEEPQDLEDPNLPPNNHNKSLDHDINGSSFHVDLDNTSQNIIDISSSECSTDDEDIPSCDDSQKQLVLYDPSINGGDDEIETVADPIAFKPPSFSRHPFGCHTQRVLPSVGAFTVQCANCFKWRLIPSQEKYEEIREHITERPFVCETAREWRPDISCDDPPDIEQDGSRLWAIDKPNIAQPPAGWHRLLRIRGEGSSKFADVYYAAPTGTKLRSIPDVEKYLLKHPEFVEQGVTLAQFSFQIPRPLQENYVRKRPARTSALPDAGYEGMPGSLEPPPGAKNTFELHRTAPIRLLNKVITLHIVAANRIAWRSPKENTDLQLGMPGFSSPYPLFDPRPAKKARSAPSKRKCNFNLVYKHHQI